MFHSAKDGKGRRYVYVNGNRIEREKWANEEQGLVCFHPYKRRPIKGEVYTRLLRGNVKVEFINETAKTSTKATSS